MSLSVPAHYWHLMLGALALGACRVCPPKLATPGQACPPGIECSQEQPRVVEPILPMDERPTPFEVSPWVYGGGGIRRGQEGTDGVASLGGGVEGTFRLGPSEDCTIDRPCTGWRPRLGPWIGFESTLDRWSGEGGLALSLAGPGAVSWSSFGLRAGAGRSTNGVTHAIAELSWGTRFVPMRRTFVYDERGPCRAVISPAAGLRVFVAARRDIDAGGLFDLTIGLEWHMLGPGLGILPNFRW